MASSLAADLPRGRPGRPARPERPGRRGGRGRGDDPDPAPDPRRRTLRRVSADEGGAPPPAGPEPVGGPQGGRPVEAAGRRPRHEAAVGGPVRGVRGPPAGLTVARCSWAVTVLSLGLGPV